MLGVGLGKQEDEFIASHSEDDIILPTCLLHHSSHFLEQLVPDIMSKRVIGEFQAVHIGEDQGEGLVELAVYFFENPIEVAAVVEGGKRIGDRESSHLLRLGPLFGGIAEDNHHPVQIAVFTDDRRGVV